MSRQIIAIFSKELLKFSEEEQLSKSKLYDYTQKSLKKLMKFNDGQDQKFVMRKITNYALPGEIVSDAYYYRVSYDLGLYTLDLVSDSSFSSLEAERMASGLMRYVKTYTDDNQNSTITYDTSKKVTTELVPFYSEEVFFKIIEKMYEMAIQKTNGDRKNYRFYGVYKLRVTQTSTNTNPMKFDEFRSAEITTNEQYNDFMNKLQSFFLQELGSSTTRVRNVLADRLQGFLTFDEFKTNYNKYKPFKKKIDSMIKEAYPRSLSKYPSHEKILKYFYKTGALKSNLRPSVKKYKWDISTYKKFKELYDSNDLFKKITESTYKLLYDTDEDVREELGYFLENNKETISTEKFIKDNPKALVKMFMDLNKVEVDYKWEAFGSDETDETTEIDMNYFSIKVIKLIKDFQKVGVFSEHTNKSSRAKKTMFIGNRQIKIVDPTPKYKKKYIHKYNCLILCLAEVFPENEELEIINDDLYNKYGDSSIQETFKVPLSRSLIKRLAKAVNVSINVYDLNDLSENEIPRLVYEYNQKTNKTINLGIVNDNHVVIINQRISSLREMSDFCTNTNNYLMAVYDIESVQCLKTNRQVPFMVGYRICSMTKDYYQELLSAKKEGSDVSRLALEKVETSETRIFTGLDCIQQFYEQIAKDSETYNCKINVFGFNSSGYDNYFIAEHVANRPNYKSALSVLKNRLYVSTKHATFKDCAPLLPPNSLMAHCNNFDLILKKKKGDVDFNFLNFHYNRLGSMDLFLEFLENTESKTGLGTIMDAITNYNKYDLYATEELCIALRTYVEPLFKKVLELSGAKDLKINYLTFDTIGQASMALFCKTNERKDPDSTTLQIKKKTNRYKYQAILDGNVMADYLYLRKATIAAVSYAKDKFNTSRSSLMHNGELKTFWEERELSAADVVSLYPTVMISKHNKFGHGDLTEVNPNTLDINCPQNWKKGIYLVHLEPIDKKKLFRRIPFKEDPHCAISGYTEDGFPLVSEKENKSEIFSYEWVHNKCIYRPLFQQDIANCVSAGEFRVTHVLKAHQFAKESTSEKIFGKYIDPFMHEKNRQDLLAKQKSPDYSPGIREVCKAFMNILSGKTVQIYDYEDCVKVSKEKPEKKNADDPEIMYDTIGSMYCFKTDNETAWERMMNLSVEERSEYQFFDYSLVGAQIYCYSREHMFKNLIDVCHNKGFEPLIIETDSLTTDTDFYTMHTSENPRINITGKDISLYYLDKSVPKEFGQLEIELKGIKKFMTFSKKSYFLETAKGYTKCRFKGIPVSGSVVISDDYERKLLDDICEFEGSARIKNEDQDMVFKIRNKYTNYYYDKLLNGSCLMSDPKVQADLFEKLTNEKEVTVMRPQLKKNITKSPLGHKLCISGYLGLKAFNRPVKTKKDAFTAESLLARIPETVDLELPEC